MIPQPTCCKLLRMEQMNPVHSGTGTSPALELTVAAIARGSLTSQAQSAAAECVSSAFIWGTGVGTVKIRKSSKKKKKKSEKRYCACSVFFLGKIAFRFLCSADLRPYLASTGYYMLVPTSCLHLDKMGESQIASESFFLCVNFRL